MDLVVAEDFQEVFEWAMCLCEVLDVRSEPRVNGLCACGSIARVELKISGDSPGKDR